MTAALHGLLVIDKPGGVTSRDVVDRVQPWFPPRTRIGHTGTLDPLATGVLVLCVGAATRLTEYVQRMEKVYEIRIQLGARSDTDDADGVIAMQSQIGEAPDRSTIERHLHRFLGETEQVPPIYSAARVAGRRAYDLARRGREVDLKPRKVTIHAIEVLAYDYPALGLRVRCGKGTYMRSLARDLGDQLGCGAYVAALRRTRIGPFNATNALSLEIAGAVACNLLLPLEAAVAELPRLVLPADELARLRQGQPVTAADLPGNLKPGQEIAVFDEARRLAAIAKIEGQSRLTSVKVLNC
ncbi:MAG TPA: tRNA pseudouridine(55) synthase TruB [Gemmataceae bacterium]|nr:tRNA pseudouridine(55) synthase TruB [Gemmataceae bacterium]